MRTIAAAKIAETVARLCQQANYLLPRDVREALSKALPKEESPRAREVLTQISENASVARERSIALCQDTGIAEVFVNLGQDVHIEGEILQDAVNRGVALGYTMGYLRTSIVADPLDRANTNDNTPAQLTVAIVPGDRLDITVLPKGGGTENASALRMFPPSAGWPAIVEFAIETVREKGINACPPLIVGVGIGGSFSAVAKLAKSALLRQVGFAPRDGAYAAREKELLDAVNALGIGPMGLGGRTTALAVHIEHAPCHIACLPVAIAMHCHSMRRMTETI
jgi:hydro-lyases, Fe-S type, tartrate/fumarate subfamily, alpha region